MKELNDLLELKHYIEQEVTQKYLISPVFEELKSLKSAYSCDTLKELWRLKGKKEGLEFFIKQLKIINETIASLKQEFDDSEKRQ